MFQFKCVAEIPTETELITTHYTADMAKRARCLESSRKRKPAKLVQGDYTQDGNWKLETEIVYMLFERQGTIRSIKKTKSLQPFQ